MLIPVRELTKFWSVNPSSLVHVGAHNAEELEQYTDAGWNQVTWIEAQPSRIQGLRERIPSHHKLIQAAVWHEEGIKLKLNIMTNTESTSLLKLGTHAIEHPTVTFVETVDVITETLKNILRDERTPDLIALDIQGAELNAIRGFGERITDVKWVYCEVNSEELYEGCCLVSDLDNYLQRYGFKRSVTRWTSHGWGDALYVNKVKTSNQMQKGSFILKQHWILINYLKNTKQFLIRKRELFKSKFNPVHD
jgi:FkbM family methyltransferase